MTQQMETDLDRRRERETARIFAFETANSNIMLPNNAAIDSFNYNRNILESGIEIKVRKGHARDVVFIDVSKFENLVLLEKLLKVPVFFVPVYPSEGILWAQLSLLPRDKMVFCPDVGRTDRNKPGDICDAYRIPSRFFRSIASSESVYAIH
jgi:hypothetical protein